MLHRNGLDLSRSPKEGQRRSWSRCAHHVSCTPDSGRSCCTSKNFRVVPLPDIGTAMGRPGERASEVLDDFIRGLGMPRRLREVKVEEADLPRLAQNCVR
jgi:hypothetical protein